ncbi:hypothetical protein KEM55_003233, partial [Ascosphaera atra]
MSSANDKLLEGKYPAKAHARKVAAKLKEEGCGDSGVIYLEGQKTHMVEDNDEAMHFRDKLTLFVPPIDPESVIWAGLPLSPEEAAEKYDVDACLTTDQVNATLAHAVKENPKNKTVYMIPEQVSPETTFLPFDEKDSTHLRNAIEESRVVKD